MWLQLTLAILQAAVALVGFLKERKLLDAGRDQEVARVALAILEKTDAGKKIAAKVAAMKDDEVDSLLKDLEG